MVELKVQYLLRDTNKIVLTLLPIKELRMIGFILHSCELVNTEQKITEV